MHALEINTTTDEQARVSLHLPKALSNLKIRVLVLINDEEMIIRDKFSESDALDFWEVSEEDIYQDYLPKYKNDKTGI